MRIFTILLTLSILHLSLRSNAGTYLATDIGCEKWHQKRLIIFADQTNISDFVRDSKVFFEHAQKEQSKDKTLTLYKEYFDKQRKPSSGNEMKESFNFSWKKEKLVSTKTLKHPWGYLTSKNTGIFSLYDLKKKTTSLDFSMEYDKNSKEIDTNVTHHFEDGTHKTIPLKDYVVFKMPKSCKHHFKISEKDYFNNKEMKLVKKERLPADVKN